MTEILNHFEPITLDQMKDIRLMNRIDTKFVTTEPVLRRLLEMAADDYFVQETDGLRISPYYTLYFDTPDCAMYNRHQVGHLSRQKIRIRSYVSAGLSFLEVKTKNNHGRTKKKRVNMEQFDALHPQHDIEFHRQDENFVNYDEFLRTYLNYDPERLTEQIEKTRPRPSVSPSIPTCASITSPQASSVRWATSSSSSSSATVTSLLPSWTNSATCASIHMASRSTASARPSLTRVCAATASSPACAASRKY